MKTTCNECGATHSDVTTSCPSCGGTAIGYTYEEEDLANGHIQPPPGFFAEQEETPHWYRWSGWLWNDDEHQRGEGTTAYRVVFKTLRVPIIGTFNLSWPNLRVRMWHGSVKVGRASVVPSHPWRREGHIVVPEWGAVADTENAVGYFPTQPSSPTLGPDEEEFGGGSFIEFILNVTDGKPDEQIAEGRRGLASLMTILDLSFGRRLLAMQLTEELGEVFEDGHFNCWPQSGLIGLESLMTVRPVAAPVELVSWARSSIDRHMRRPESERRTLGLACEWYRLAESTLDPVLEFVYLWLCIEVLAMPNTTNIRPVRERLADGLGGSEADWREAVGRFFGFRSEIVHGNRREVSEEDVSQVRDIVESLLELDLGWVSVSRRNRLIAIARTSEPWA